MSNDWITDLAQRLDRFGTARDRAVDREVRTVTITDDEALLMLHLLQTAERIVLGNEETLADAVAVVMSAAARLTAAQVDGLASVVARWSPP